MSALLRAAAELRAAQLTTGDRAFHALREAVTTGSEIRLSDHDLVIAISRALWNREVATAQVGLSELEVRTLADPLRRQDERSAA